ncbi:MAG: SNF2 helicase associated domain-containing protein [Clostridium sp.]
MDLGEFSMKELGHILDCLQPEKKYYRLKTGQFLELDQGGMLYPDAPGRENLA